MQNKTSKYETKKAHKHKNGKLWGIAYGSDPNFDALLQSQTFKFLFTLFTPMSNQDRISPYNINTITTR